MSRASRPKAPRSSTELAGEHDGDDIHELIPAHVAHAYSLFTSPRGAAIRRHAAWRGEGGALRPGLHPGLGRLREPPWGYYGPCARSLARRGGAAAVRRQACDDPLREAGAPCPSAIDAPPNGSAARSFQERRQAERHGACGWWLNPSAPRPGSMEAADTRASRRSAAPRHPRTPAREPGGQRPMSFRAGARCRSGSWRG